MSNFDEKITGFETLWGDVQAPTKEELDLINSSPTLVNQLLQYQKDIDDNKASPMARFDGHPEGMQTSNGVNGGLRIDMGSKIIGSEAVKFVGSLSYELGHYVNYTNNRNLFNGVVESLNPSDPNYRLMAGAVGTITEAESQANNYIVQQQIFAKTGIKILLNGDGANNANGLIQQTLDAVYASNNGAPIESLFEKLKAGALNIAGTFPALPSDRGFIDFFDYYSSHPNELYNNFNPTNPRAADSGLQGAQAIDANKIIFLYNDASPMSIKINLSGGDSRDIAFSGAKIRSSSYIDSSGKKKEETIYDTDGNYSVTSYDVATGHKVFTQNYTKETIKTTHANWIYNDNGIFEPIYEESGALVGMNSYDSSGRQKGYARAYSDGSSEWANFDSESGQMTQRQRGLTDGRVVTYEEFFRNGNRKELKTFLADGKGVSQDKFWYENGNQKEIQYWDAGGYIAKKEFFYETGIKSRVENIDSKFFIYAVQEFYPDGALAMDVSATSVGNIFNDVATSVKRNYDQGGRLTDETVVPGYLQPSTITHFNADGSKEITVRNPYLGQPDSYEKYDASGRLILRSTYDNSGTLLNNPSHKLATVTEGRSDGGRTELSYDAQGRLSTQRQFDASGNLQSTVGSSIDDKQRLHVRIELADGKWYEAIRSSSDPNSPMVEEHWIGANGEKHDRTWNGDKFSEKFYHPALGSVDVIRIKGELFMIPAVSGAIYSLPAAAEYPNFDFTKVAIAGGTIPGKPGGSTGAAVPGLPAGLYIPPGGGGATWASVSINPGDPVSWSHYPAGSDTPDFSIQLPFGVSPKGITFGPPISVIPGGGASVFKQNFAGDSGVSPAPTILAASTTSSIPNTEALVHAMAAFSPPTSGVTNSALDGQASPQTVLVANLR
ncbi:hypothetical protein [Burkholderia ubonensis]|uniref:hypothetical protein n=1 Tax=Burkholderia ubonensis TaxID=101571 RepID=UPI000A96E444|nr:hypothetical protein [Burkholderia ubonensis]